RVSTGRRSRAKPVGQRRRSRAPPARAAALSGTERSEPLLEHERLLDGLAVAARGGERERALEGRAHRGVLAPRGELAGPRERAASGLPASLGEEPLEAVEHGLRVIGLAPPEVSAREVEL